MASGLSEVPNSENTSSRNVLTTVSFTESKSDKNDISASDESSSESEIDEMTSDFQQQDERGSNDTKITSRNSKLISQLERELSVNPLQYDKHIQLIALLKESADLDRLRESRLNMHKYFPLTPEMWLSWLKDELPLVKMNEQAFFNIIEIFHKATQDYLSTEIWLLFCEFARENIALWGNSGVSKVREIFITALEHMGYHMGEGDLLWSKYIEFELILFNQLQQLQAEDADSEELRDKVRTQYDRITQLYKRRLSLPIISHKITEEVAKTWDPESLPTPQILARAKHRFQGLLSYEISIMTHKGTPSMDLYSEYMQAELELGNDFNRVVCLYERCIATHPLNQTVWIEYTKFLEASQLDKDRILSVHKRCVRNVFWVSQCWVNALRANEKLNISKSEMEEVFLTCLNYQMNSEDMLKICIEYLSYLWRCTPRDISSLHESIDFCDSALDYRYAKLGDPNCELKQFKIEVCTFEGENEKARLLWDSILNTSLMYSNSSFWLKYVSFERQHGNHDSLRNALSRAAANVTDCPELCQQLVRYYRFNGSLQQLCEAEELLQQRITACAAAKIPFWSHSLGKDNRKRTKFSDKQYKHTNKFSDNKLKSNKEDTKAHSKPTARIYKAKKIKTISSDSDDEMKSTKNIENSSLEAPKMEEISQMDTQILIINENSDRKIFLSNLASSIEENTLKELFTEYGEIEEVFLSSKKSKKLCLYGAITFAEKSSVAKALKLDRFNIEGRPIYVSEYVGKLTPTSERPQKYKKDLNTKVLYVSNLPPNLSEQELKDLARQHGAVKEVRMIYSRKDRKKGYAFIEFEDERSASNALLGLDQLKINDFTIKAAISNPPTPKTINTQTNKQTASTNSKKSSNVINTEDKRRGKSQVDRKIQLMLPRSLYDMKLMDTASNSTTDAEESIAKNDELSVDLASFTNDDFRRFLDKNK